MRNQPKYIFFKNARYAIHGLVDIVQTEKSFRLELYLFVILQLIVIFLPFTLVEKIVLSSVLFVPLIVEALNSAIERVVDLVTLEHHQMAKKAKDAGSAAVFISLVFTGFVWAAILLMNFLET